MLQKHCFCAYQTVTSALLKASLDETGLVQTHSKQLWTPFCAMIFKIWLLDKTRGAWLLCQFNIVYLPLSEVQLTYTVPQNVSITVTQSRLVYHGWQDLRPLDSVQQHTVCLVYAMCLINAWWSGWNFMLLPDYWKHSLNLSSVLRRSNHDDYVQTFVFLQLIFNPFLSLISLFLFSCQVTKVFYWCL